MNDELKKAIREQLLTFKSQAPPETISEFSSLDANDLSLCHFGLGLYIRNNYLLPEGKLYMSFMDNGITSKDDMSSIMLNMWHEILNMESKHHHNVNDKIINIQEGVHHEQTTDSC